MKPQLRRLMELEKKQGVSMKSRDGLSNKRRKGMRCRLVGKIDEEGGVNR